MPDRIDDLERLVRLRDQGALTEAEFAEQKARLLDRPAALPDPISAAPETIASVVPEAEQFSPPQPPSAPLQRSRLPERKLLVGGLVGLAVVGTAAWAGLSSMRHTDASPAAAPRSRTVSTSVATTAEAQGDAGAGSAATGQSQAGRTFGGYCHMGSCSWFSIVKADDAGRNAQGVLKAVTMTISSSEMKDDEPDAAQPREAGGTIKVHEFCSKSSPAEVSKDDDGASHPGKPYRVQWLTPAADEVTGADHPAYYRYFAACHGVELKRADGSDDIAAMGRRLGYAPFKREAGEENVARPEDVLNNRFQVSTAWLTGKWVNVEQSGGCVTTSQIDSYGRGGVYSDSIGSEGTWRLDGVNLHVHGADPGGDDFDSHSAVVDATANAFGLREEDGKIYRYRRCS